MLADIGGSLGLFIGASVLSIGEIIEALYMYLHVLCSRRKERLETMNSNGHARYTVGLCYYFYTSFFIESVFHVASYVLKRLP